MSPTILLASVRIIFFVTARQEVGQTRDSPFRPRPAFIEVIDHGPKDLASATARWAAGRRLWPALRNSLRFAVRLADRFAEIILF